MLNCFVFFLLCFFSRRKFRKNIFVLHFHFLQRGKHSNVERILGYACTKIPKNVLKKHHIQSGTTLSALVRVKFGHSLIYSSFLLFSLLLSQQIVERAPIKINETRRQYANIFVASLFTVILGDPSFRYFFHLLVVFVSSANLLRYSSS